MVSEDQSLLKFSPRKCLYPRGLSPILATLKVSKTMTSTLIRTKSKNTSVSKTHRIVAILSLSATRSLIQDTLNLKTTLLIRTSKMRTVISHLEIRRNKSISSRQVILKSKTALF